MTPEELAARFIHHFSDADRQMRWSGVEEERSFVLTDGVVVAGRVDAYGPDWFGEWKTMNPRWRRDWKMKWRFHPQTLTYGLLMHETDHSGRRFTVRAAFKNDIPTDRDFDYEWYEYSDAELDFWRQELIGIADRIKQQRGNEHWSTNPLSCLQYGSKYPCPFYKQCVGQRWYEKPEGAVSREPHLSLEQTAQELILDATRIVTYLTCAEKYRREYVTNIVGASAEALLFGGRFHDLLGAYYGSVFVRGSNG